MRGLVRKAAVAGLSAKASFKGQSWVRFPCYHHVFADERKGFERQLQYMRTIGEFIPMDDAIEMITGGSPIDGRYFSVTFDDGFRNCLEHMMPITAELGVPVIIYLPTDYIGRDASTPSDAERMLRFYPEDPKLVEFLNWDECRSMLGHGVSFGSHTVNHAHLIELGADAITDELKRSKEAIEEKLGIACRHFACPWGKPVVDFDPAVAPGIARALGYSSFAASNRGAMRAGGDVFMLTRDHMVADWENFQLRYFLSR
ncbi:MAG: polysaccharide deacetylase family protein [Flavobacteriales bacterium]|nr:polysaccharide deacetylase family protein [Flavobacteriales bacterium]